MLFPNEFDMCIIGIENVQGFFNFIYNYTTYITINERKLKSKKRLDKTSSITNWDRIGDNKDLLLKYKS